MKRILSKAIYPLVAGVCLRMVMVLKFPAGAGDTVIYEQLATNWLKHGKYAMDIGGQAVPVDLRMPGYSAFLAVVYALTGHTGESARLAVMLAQVIVDMLGCVVIAALAVLLATLCSRQANCGRTFLAGVVAGGFVPVHGELCGGATDGGVGDVSDGSGAVDFGDVGGRGARRGAGVAARRMDDRERVLAMDGAGRIRSRVGHIVSAGGAAAAGDQPGAAGNVDVVARRDEEIREDGSADGVCLCDTADAVDGEECRQPA